MSAFELSAIDVTGVLGTSCRKTYFASSNAVGGTCCTRVLTVSKGIETVVKVKADTIPAMKCCRKPCTNGARDAFAWS